MPASIAENILARVSAALLGATSAGARVERGRSDPFSAEDVPAINIRRTNSDDEPVGDKGTRWLVQFEIDCHVSGAADWETAVDALHMEVHAILAADTQLAQLGRGLRCTNTDAVSDSADRVVGRLTVRYQMQVFVRPGDLTRQIT